MRFIFSLRLPQASREMSAPNVAAKRKKNRHCITIFSLIGLATFAVLCVGCADAYYADNWRHSPEAKYNTDHMPLYYPYYPWDGYYGGAYYYGE